MLWPAAPALNMDWCPCSAGILEARTMLFVRSQTPMRCIQHSLDIPRRSSRHTCCSLKPMLTYMTLTTKGWMHAFSILLCCHKDAFDTLHSTCQDLLPCIIRCCGMLAGGHHMTPCARAMAALRAPRPQAVVEPTGDRARTTLMTFSTSGGSAKGEQTQHRPLRLPSSIGGLRCL